MRPEYEMFNHTNINTINDKDVIKFIMENETIEYFQINLSDKTIEESFTKLKDYGLLAIICCGNEFSIGDFEYTVTEICEKFSHPKERKFGWKVDESINNQTWNAHILIGIHEEQVSEGDVI